MTNKKTSRRSPPPPRARPKPPAIQAGRRTPTLAAAQAALNAGDPKKAEALAGQWLAAHPDDAQAHKLLSVVIGKDPRRLPETLRHCQEAVRLQPDDLEGLCNLALAQKSARQPKEAINTLIRRANLRPGDAQVHLDLARMMRDLGQLEPAEVAYGNAAKLRPEDASVLAEAGAMWQHHGDLDKAVAAYKRAIAADPAHAPAHNDLGVVLSDLGRLDQAQAAFEAATRLNGDNAIYFNNLGNTYYRQARIAEAVVAYGKAIAVDPGYGYALGQGLHASRQLCAWRELDASIEKIRQMLAGGKARGLAPFVLLAQPGIGLAEQKVCARLFAHQRHGKELKRKPLIQTVPARKREDGKVRIGYLSADFHEHATSYLMVGVLEHHDRSRFEIYAYSYGPDDRSATRSRVKKAFDVFRDIRKLTDEQAAKRILDDGIDILVDLKGYTRDMRLGIQALRPAPVVVSWLGYPGTLGEERMADYVIGDPTVTPLEHAPHYSEKLALMPHCYQPNDRSRVVAAIPSRAEAGLPETGLVFCTFNQPYKITPGMLDLWCRLLHAVPGSVLWVLAPKDEAARANLQAEIEQRGIAAGRLIFAAKKPQAEHLARLSLADLALDTLPYTSHTTCSDALWVGLPLVTLMGETFPARVAASILKTMDLPELVTETPDDYYARMLELALSPDRRAALKQKILRHRETSPLFDTALFTRDLEWLYRRMWSNHLVCRHEPIVPWSVMLASAPHIPGRKPAPMRVAVVTPYYQESLAELRACHDSVAGQTVECTHFMVADGFPNPELDAWPLRHIKLPVAHGDGGNCARTLGALAAVGEKFDAIAFLDADNWYYPDHIERMLEMHERDNADICVARRNLHRVDGSLLKEDASSDGKNFVDTSCYFLTSAAFPLLPVWGLMPREVWGICDRVFFAAVQGHHYRLAVHDRPTVAYRSRWEAHYRSVGEEPPDGWQVRNEHFRAASINWMGMTPVQKQRVLMLK